jgi:hypothetical protein
MNRTQSISRRGFLRNVMGVTTAIFVGPGLILPEEGLILPEGIPEDKLCGFYAYETIMIMAPISLDHPLFHTYYVDRGVEINCPGCAESRA